MDNVATEEYISENARVSDGQIDRHVWLVGYELKEALRNYSN